MSEEQWRPVVGYEGRYEVSDLGRVRALGRRAGVMSPQLNRGGYPFVQFRRGEQRKSLPVHRLVIVAFRGQPEEGQVCRHLNGVKTDSRLSNLAWGTPSENAHDAVRHGDHPMARKTHCKNDHPLSGLNVKLLRQAGGRGMFRRCRACNNETARLRRKSSASAPTPVPPATPLTGSEP